MLFLRNCYNARQEVDAVEDLENSANMRIIVSKLLFTLWDKWRSVACSIRDACNRKPKFKDLLEFIENQTQVKLDPLFGEIQNPKDNKRIPKPKPTTTKGGFRLDKSFSNHHSVLSVIPESDSTKGVKTLDLRRDQLHREFSGMLNKMQKQ